MVFKNTSKERHEFILSCLNPSSIPDCVKVKIFTYDKETTEITYGVFLDHIGLKSICANAEVLSSKKCLYGLMKGGLCISPYTVELKKGQVFVWGFEQKFILILKPLQEFVFEFTITPVSNPDAIMEKRKSSGKN